METALLKEKIKDSIIKMHNYLRAQDYYEDISSYALYTDDSYMSITMILIQILILIRKGMISIT